MVPTAERPSEPLRYKLYGVLYHHHGEFAGSGQYTVDVLRPGDDGNEGEVWLHIDDETANLVQHGDVFVEHGTVRATEERCAYFLFYYRTSDIGTSQPEFLDEYE
jgi:ubiquitin C-terminal hydrolase